MRKISVRPPTFTPNEPRTFALPPLETAPVPIGPLSPLGAELDEAPLSLPPQMNAPAGPPPPPVVDLPTDYEGYVELCKKVSRGQMSDKALIWANLAQADALNRSARALEGLLEIAQALTKTKKSVKKPAKKPEEG